MKIRIDTDNKILTLEESINIGDLMDKLETLLPEGMWREFKLDTNVINNWTNPIVIKEHPVYPYNPNPFNPVQPFTPIQPYPNQITTPCDPLYPWIIYGTTTTSVDTQTDFKCQLAPGVFNVEYPKK